MMFGLFKKKSLIDEVNELRLRNMGRGAHWIFISENEGEPTQEDIDYQKEKIKEYCDYHYMPFNDCNVEWFVMKETWDGHTQCSIIYHDDGTRLTPDEVENEL